MTIFRHKSRNSKSGRMHAYEKVNKILVFSVFELPIFSHKTHDWEFILKYISLKTKLQNTLKKCP
jgi:hypothetical protein